MYVPSVFLGHIICCVSMVKCTRRPKYVVSHVCRQTTEQGLRGGDGGGGGNYSLDLYKASLPDYQNSSLPIESQRQDI